MRDPFKPPEDRCRISELSQWRFQGMVGRGEASVIKDGQKKWRRVQQNDPGKRLDDCAADARRTNADTGKNCEPPQWLWQRQERYK
ncbi:HofP DNA utilization family protein [Acinetobacter baumannii]|uniref:HofP DNA utilization family protein n=1 Tax=Acinetobacter baumannii TaxID=470 RepID=UPI003D2FA936